MMPVNAAIIVPSRAITPHLTLPSRYQLAVSPSATTNDHSCCLRFSRAFLPRLPRVSLALPSPYHACRFRFSHYEGRVDVPRLGLGRCCPAVQFPQSGRGKRRGKGNAGRNCRPPGHAVSLADQLRCQRKCASQCIIKQHILNVIELITKSKIEV